MVQNTESDIETNLPNELLRKIFSFLPYQSISHTYVVSSRWRLLSFDHVRLSEPKCFQAYIDRIAANLEDKYKTTSEKIAALKFDNTATSLLQIKKSLLASREQLVSLLKELDNEKLMHLKALPGDKPLHFQNIFADALKYVAMRNLAFLYYQGNRLDAALHIARPYPE